MKTAVAAVAFLSFHLNSNAQVLSAVKYDRAATDTTGRYLKAIQPENPGFVVNNTTVANSLLKDVHLEQDLQLKISRSAERKLLMKHLRDLNIGADVDANRSNKKLFYNLANVFARLKMYSLAMKCFFKTLQYNKHAEISTDTLVTNAADTISTDSTTLDARYLNFNAKDDTLLAKQPDSLLPGNTDIRSPKITYRHITETFKDGKKAVAYAMLIHVKQPISGKPKIYHFTNTGHTFITLIKYNSDSTYVSLSFGFYPNKNHPLAGSPLFPSSNSMFRDDTEHKWDEVAGKFISKRRFEKILALTKNYEGVKYHLSKNNCTDFSLNAALMADLKVNDTAGKWPLGHGNNPGITGESMRLHKITDGRKPNLEEVFLDDTVKQ